MVQPPERSSPHKGTFLNHNKIIYNQNHNHIFTPYQNHNLQPYQNHNKTVEKLNPKNWSQAGLASLNA